LWTGNRTRDHQDRSCRVPKHTRRTGSHSRRGL